MHAAHVSEWDSLLNQERFLSGLSTGTLKEEAERLMQMFIL